MKIDWTWFQTKFGEWFAGTLALVFLFVSVLTAIVVVFIMDGLWARNQAPEGLELVFQMGGWAIRLWAIFGLTLAIMVWQAGGRVFSGLIAASWLYVSILSFGHVLGFFAEGQMERYAGAEAVDGVAETTVDSLADRVAVFEGFIADERAAMNADVTALENALDDLINDGSRANDEAATAQYTPLITARKEAGNAKIRAWQADIAGLYEDKQTARDTAASATTEKIKVDPLYVWIAEWRGKAVDAAGEANDEGLKGTAKGGAVSLAVALEFLAGGGMAIFYSALSLFRGRADTVHRFGDYEATSDEIETALRHRRNWEDGQNSKVLKINQSAYLRQMRSKIREGMRVGLDAESIRESTRLETWNEFETLARRVLKPDEFQALMNNAPDQYVNGADQSPNPPSDNDPDEPRPAA